MTNIAVADRAELLTALKTAKGGETFVLASGNYGDVSITKDYASTVTLVSKSGQGAKFETLTLSSAENVTVKSITATDGLRIESGSHDITIADSDVSGNGSTLYVRNSQSITLKDNDISASVFGLVMNVVKDFKVTGNTIHEASEDLVRIVGDSNGLFENNTVYDSVAKKGTHSDLLQMFGLYNKSPHDIVIRGNLFYDDTSTGTQAAQGIFLKDGSYRNILIEDNLIRTNASNTLYVSNGVENVMIRNNTLMPGDGDGGANLRLAGSKNTGVTVENNVAKILLDEGGVSEIGTNYIYGRWADLSKLFQGKEGGEWSDFLPVSGSKIDFGKGMGAVNRLSDLLAGDDKIEAAPPEETAVKGPDGAEAISAVVSLAGAGEFSGASADMLTIEHDASLALDEGTIAFSFNADTASYRRGIFSKDDGDDGRLSVWVQEGQLKAAFQNGGATVTIASDKILRKNTDYDVTVNFDHDSVGLYLNGKLVGEKAFDMSLEGNDGDLTVGAGTIYLGRTQDAHQVYGYDGTVSDFTIYDHAMTPEELASLKADSLEGYTLA